MTEPTPSTQPMAIICPGQGAQAIGMGRAWAEASAEARAVFDEADATLGDSLGAPLSRLCFEGPEDTLNRTDVCQPALFTAAVASWRVLCAALGYA
ncbi:MAG: acyltransferase domain-containing protein [Planctomycetota bacterium]